MATRAKTKSAKTVKAAKPAKVSAPAPAKQADPLQGMMASDGLAIFASRPEESRGRMYSEPPSKTRGDFERDRDRVIHSQAFRRLKFKTQVFVYHEGDHFRTRLSHSIEVAQVARSLSRLLKCDQDLAEVGALAHDVGHTPFAHVDRKSVV